MKLFTSFPQIISNPGKLLLVLLSISLFPGICFSQSTANATAVQNLSVDSLGRVIDLTFDESVNLTAPWDRFRFDIDIVAPQSRDAGAFLGDLTGDGIPDLILASFDGERVFFPGLPNNPRKFGNGSYLKFLTVDPAADPYHGEDAYWITGVVGDLDNDGNKEIIIGKEVFENVGTASEPTLQLVYTFSTGGSWDPAPSLGDLNGDGKLDVIISLGYSGGTYVYWNNCTTGSFNFIPELLHVFDWAPENRLSVADVNGDDLLDLCGAKGIYINYGTKEVPIFDYANPEKWNIEGGVSWTPSSDQGTNVFLIDANQDGLVDAYVSNTSSTVWQVLYYENIGTPASHKLIYKGPVVASSAPLKNCYRGSTEPSFSPNRAFVAAADIDNNGRQDILLSDEGGTAFGAPTIIWNFTTEEGTQTSPVFCYQDLYTFPNLQYVDYNGGAGLFEETDILCKPPNLFSAWIDMTGDGIPDMIQTNQWMDEYSINICTKSDVWPYSYKFDAINTIPSGKKMVGWGLAFSDVDMDGNTDIITGTENGQLLFYKNTGTPGIYNDPLQLTDSSGTPIDVGGQSWPAAIDLDDDGDMDLLVGEENGIIHKVVCNTPGSIGGYELDDNLGSSEQDPVDVTHIVGGGTITPTLCTLDVDNDGLDDVVMGDVSGRVWLLHNVGDVNSPSFDLIPFNISRTTAAYMQITGTNSVRLHFSLPTSADNTIISFHDIPTSHGTISGSSIITSPSAQENKNAILKINVSQLSFGNILVGQFKDTTIVLTNPGTDTLKILKVTSSDTTFTIRPTVMKLPPTGLVMDTIRFSPTVEGITSADIVFFSNADSSPDTIKIFGTGYLPTSAENQSDEVPKTYSLDQNYPNPFNPSTRISFAIPQPSFVSLKIYNLLGQEIETLVSEYLPAGWYNIEWRAAYLASGVYVYRLHAGNFVSSKKLMLLQ